MKTCLSLVLFAYIAVCSTVRGQATFTPLGFLPGSTASYSDAVAVSADGSVVVGTSNAASGFQAFRWTASGGMVGLGELPGGMLGSHARDVSADGSAIIGSSASVNSSSQPFLWTAAGGMVGLGNLLPGTYAPTALAISGDGLVIVGVSTRGEIDNDTTEAEAFRWTTAGGIGLGDLPGQRLDSWADGVSTDGSVVVGYGLSALGREAFRWTSADGMVGLGDLPGGEVISAASDVSDDGSVIVGNSHSSNGSEAFRWTPAIGMQGLGSLPGEGFHSSATAVSGDGSVVVGLSQSSALPSPNQAFYWTEELGMVNLPDLLLAHGASNVAGWKDLIAADVSADGLTVVGYGTSPSGNTEAWVATIPEPSTFFLASIALLLLFTVCSRRALAIAASRLGTSQQRRAVRNAS
jgi:probable HAF family extracellular repeat protein